jgi:hypothetical protein
MTNVPKKVFYMDAFFHLPDDFGGGISDALRLMANYHDSVKNTSKQEMEKGIDDKCHPTYEENWNYFLNAVKNGKKIQGLTAICEYNEEKDKMELVKDYNKK